MTPARYRFCFIFTSVSSLSLYIPGPQLSIQIRAYSSRGDPIILHTGLARRAGHHVFWRVGSYELPKEPAVFPCPPDVLLTS